MIQNTPQTPRDDVSLFDVDFHSSARVFSSSWRLETELLIASETGFQVTSPDYDEMVKISHANCVE